MKLTEAEASIRALRIELTFRRLFRQKERRVKAHVMVAFLGYALWVTLKLLLQRRPALIPKPAAADVGNTQPLTPMQALALLSKLHSGDIVLPTTDGREIRLRRVTEPTAEQKSLLDLLGSSLPDRLSFNRQCSVDSGGRRIIYKRVARFSAPRDELRLVPVHRNVRRSSCTQEVRLQPRIPVLVGPKG